MTSSTIALKNVCKIESGAGFPIKYQGLSDQEFPFFKVGDMNSKGNEKGMYVFAHSISDEVRKKLKAKTFPTGTIIFPKIGAAIATNKKRVLIRPSCVDNNVMAIIPSKKISSDYLFYLFQNKDLSDFANRGNPPSIRKTTIEEWKFPLPPLPEQKRIAAQLAQADRLRQLRRNASQLGESYLQSAFLEMFGDPIKTNPKGYKICELRDVCTRITDGTHQPPKWAQSGLPFLFVSNVVDGELTFDTKKFISEETWYELKRRCPIELNDILYTIVGSYGNAALVRTTRKFSFQRHIAHVKPNSKKIHPVFLLSIMKSINFREQVEQKVRGVAQKTLNLGELQEIKIFIPPLPEQERFAQIVARYEKLRAQMRESTRHPAKECGAGAEMLFQGLLAGVFRSARR